MIDDLRLTIDHHDGQRQTIADRHHPVTLPLIICALAALTLSSAQQGEVRYLKFHEVREVLDLFADSGLPGSGVHQQAEWDSWIRLHDREVRSRIDRGIEDSLSNLILYGTSYTQLPRLAGAESAISADGQLIPAAQARVRQFAAALASPGHNERLIFARDFLMKKGIAEGARERYLANNLCRFSLEQRSYPERLREAETIGDPAAVLFVRSTLFEQRGLSVDTSLLPNYAIESTLARLKEKGVLQPGCIRRIAVIGPGLDFADKRDGYDFYPLQTLQPFAILEAVLRLGLADAGKAEVITLDLSPAVNAHIAQARRRARSGESYTIQLPREADSQWVPEAIAYWNRFGAIIGTPAAAALVPSSLKGLMLRAIAIKPRFSFLMQSLDLNIVTQTVDFTEGNGFDLVVATNVLVYYGRFEQALAMASLAHLMNGGAVFLANHALPAQHPSALEYLGRRSINYSTAGAFGDDVVVYRRAKSQ